MTQDRDHDRFTIIHCETTYLMYVSLNDIRNEWHTVQKFYHQQLHKLSHPIPSCLNMNRFYLLPSTFYRCRCRETNLVNSDPDVVKQTKSFPFAVFVFL